MVVSMRIFNGSDERKIVDISKMFLFAHGEPVYIGEPKNIGINIQKIFLLLLIPSKKL